MSEPDAQALAEEQMGIEPHPEEIRLPLSLRPLVQLVQATLGQWRMASVTVSAGMGGAITQSRPVALDLNAVDVAARWLGLLPTPELLQELQVVQAEALKLMERDRD